jgi:hypothetical protein
MIPPNTPKRPARKGDAVIQFAANALAHDVQQWCQDNTSLEQLEEDLGKALHYSRDGYRIAKELEKEGYDPDEELVEILGKAAYYFNESWITACMLWVKDNNLAPPEIGIQVRQINLIVHPNLTDPGIGTIVSNHPDGRSTVSFPDLGHIGHIKDRDPKSTGTIGFIVEWENLEPA